MNYKLNIISLNIFSAILYGIALFVDQKIGISILKNAMGLSYLLLVIPLTISYLFPIKNFSGIERYFMLIACFFSIYVPFFYFLNRYFFFPISTQNIFFINLSLFIFSVAIHVFRSIPIQNYDLPAIRFSKIRKEWIFLTALSLYAGIHMLNYHFYGFIPEWDSYGDLIRISHGIESGMIETPYRGFFATATQILSVFSGLNPYLVFSIIYIALQSTLIFAIRSLLDEYEIRKTASVILIYAIALSIPVVNMEIDMVRPQNIFIILFPIFFIFILRFLRDRSAFSGFFAIIIAASGINYHEFFTFPLLISVGLIGISMAKKSLRTPTSKDALIFILITLVGILFLTSLSETAPFPREIISIAKKILIGVSDTSSWRLWFLGHYESDGDALQMGWPGFDGAMKYYAYYLSPALSIILLVLGFSLIKRNLMSKDILFRTSLPFIASFLLFAEILPRFNYLYLPERFWLLIDIMLIFVAIPLIRYLDTRKYATSMSTLLFILCLIGSVGSIYVAKNKKSLTSQGEYRAAMWIQTNTPEKAVFISQSANSPMIQFFAHRTMISVEPEYFLSDEIIEQNPEKKIAEIRKLLKRNLDAVSRLTKKFAENKISFLEFSNTIQKRKTTIKRENKEIDQWESTINQSKYVVYSYDKFDTIYRNREWWLRSNFFGANIEKFNRTYPLVYQDGGVYIWKIR